MHRVFPAPMVRDMGANVFNDEKQAAAAVETYLKEHDIDFDMETEEYTIVKKRRIYKDKAGRALARVDMV